jgi:F-type H+-transporting ATPase subunit b
VEESKENAKHEGERLILSAKAQIDQEIQQAKDGLRQEVTSLALAAAQQILGAEIDKAKHQDILNKVSNQLG